MARFRAEIRPTTDRARETLFNVVRDRVPGSVWLDLFTGSGAVGIEAISRGARHVVFNDRNRESTALVRKNLALCRVEEGFEIHQKDSFTLLRNLRPPSVDFVFLDPPYKFKRHAKLLERLSVMPWMHPESTIVLEVFKKTPRPETTSRVTWTRTVRVGDNKLLFYSLPGEPREPGRGPPDETGIAPKPGSPWQKSSRHSTVPASRRTALRLGHILPVCSLIAPCPAGAGTVSVLARLSPRTAEAVTSSFDPGSRTRDRGA